MELVGTWGGVCPYSFGKRKAIGMKSWKGIPARSLDDLIVSMKCRVPDVQSLPSHCDFQEYGNIYCANSRAPLHHGGRTAHHNQQRFISAALPGLPPHHLRASWSTRSSSSTTFPADTAGTNLLFASFSRSSRWQLHGRCCCPDVDVGNSDGLSRGSAEETLECLALLGPHHGHGR